MGKLSSFFFGKWHIVINYILATVGVVALLGYQLVKITKGMASASELATIQQSASLHGLLHNPLFLPYKCLTYLLLKTPLQSLTAVRLTSVIFGAASIWLFYRIVKNWYTPRVAVLATILYATSSWFLNTARFGSPQILFTAILVGLWAGLLFRSYERHPWLVVVVAGLVPAICYVPGLIWFVLAAAIWQFKHIIKVLKTLPIKPKLAAFLIGLIGFAPLVAGLILEPQFIRPLLGVPQPLPTVHTMLTNLLNIPLNLFYHGPTNPAVWIAGTPLVDFFGLVMLVLGLYALRFNFALDRIQMLLALLILSTVLLIFGGINIIILQPLVYVAIASGIAFMLQQWFTVFPRNPLARLLAVTLLTAAIGLSCYYQLSHYFIAWRHSPETQAVYNIQVPSNLLK